MAQTTYQVPVEFTDEDKYFRYFTKPALCSIGIAGVLGFGIYSIFNSFGAGMVGIITGGVLVAVAAALSMLPMPEEKYLKGAGSKIGVILIRVIVRRRRRVIYIRDHGGTE